MPILEPCMRCKRLIVVPHRGAHLLCIDCQELVEDSPVVCPICGVPRSVVDRIMRVDEGTVEIVFACGHRKAVSLEAEG